MFPDCRFHGVECTAVPPQIQFHEITGRRVTYVDSNMNGAGFVVAGGSGLYTQGRWGDYSAVAPDNSAPGKVLMWTAGDYDASGNWGTAISAQTYLTPKDQ